MNKFILTVTLNPAIDKTIKISNFRIGHDFREKELHVSAGGKGINTSQVLKHIGAHTLATGFLGGDSGQYIKKQLNAEKIKHDFCFIKGNTRTSLTVIDPDSHIITRILERGPTIIKKELLAFKNKFSSLLKSCSYVLISGRNAMGVPDEFYADLIKEAKEKNVFTVLDTSGKPYFLGLKAKPSMIKPNLKETEQVLGRSITNLSEIKKAAVLFYKRGIKIIAITMGSKGAIIFDGKQMLLAESAKLKRKNPVGCGDSFLAGFITSHKNNKSLSTSVKMAIASGAANALSVNPGDITPGAIKKILPQVKIKMLKY